MTFSKYQVTIVKVGEGSISFLCWVAYAREDAKLGRGCRKCHKIRNPSGALWISDEPSPTPPSQRRGYLGGGRQRLPQAWEEIGGSGPAVLRQAGEGGQLPGCYVPSLCQSPGTGPGGQAPLPAEELNQGPGPLCGGGCAGGKALLPIEDGTGLGAGPSTGSMGCRRRCLRDVAILP